MLEIKIFNKTITVDKRNGVFVVNGDFKESEHPRDEDGKFTSGSGAEKKPEKLNIKKLKIIQETTHSYQVELPNGGSYWIKKSKINKDGSINLDLDTKAQEKPKAQENLEEKEVLTYPKTNPAGYEISVDEKDKNNIAEIAKLSKRYGHNLRSGEELDDFAIEYLTQKRIDEIGDMGFYELSGYEARNLQELNQIIEDDENNNFGRTEPFKTEEDAKSFMREQLEKNAERMAIEDFNYLDEEEWDKIKEAFEDSSGREDYFYDYADTIDTILLKNGFFTSKDNSRISDSSYINVYKSRKDRDEGEPFAKIRISDHDTHRFYGHHINLYTTENVYKEINKLLRSFANADYGVEETVYNEGLK